VIFSTQGSNEMNDLTNTFDGAIALIGGVRCYTERQIVVAKLARVCRRFPDDTMEMLCGSQAEPIMLAAYGMDEDENWYDLTDRQIKRLVRDIEKFNTQGGAA